LLAYITYFIVTIIIRFVQLEANLAAAGRLSPRIACRLPAGYTRRNCKLRDVRHFQISLHGQVLIHGRRYRCL